MKRDRSTSPSHLYPPDDTSVTEHNHKFQRIEEAASSSCQPLWCSLGPGCAPPNEPTSFQTFEELETHYTQCHAYVCNAEGCSCVFEREFYLNLHQTELHDPLVQIRKETGEAIYACLLPECTQKMQSPNQRKRHLINEHRFDERFFFAVIRFGIGDQIRAWGSGVGERVQITQRRNQAEKFQDPMKLSTDFSYEGGRYAPKSSVQRCRGSSQPFSDPCIEDLTHSMKNASLVPDSIQFGRSAAKMPPEHPSYKRNASFGDVKMPSSLYSRQSELSDDASDVSDGEEGQAASLERGELQHGVRFAEEVDVRMVTPIGRMYGDTKRGRRRHIGAGSSGHGRTGARKDGVHSDDEARGRSKNFRENRTPPHSGYRGRARGNRGGKTSRERGPRGDGN